MGFSVRLVSSLAAYLLRNTVQGRKRYPMVLMLEPLFRCNLQCAGCGRIREYSDILDRTMSREECLSAVEEAGAPVVSLTGGEPLLHPEIAAIVRDIVGRKRFVNLCTNGVILERSLEKFEPDPRLYLVVHLDGLAETHDRLAGRGGVFETALAAIRTARRRGFQVLVNTTLYKETDPEETGRLFALLSSVPVDGVMVTPAFAYEAASADVFLSRGEISRRFRALYDTTDKVLFYNTPLYLEFLAGNLDLRCRPWSTPTRNPRGWKSPCYLLTDGHFRTFRELMEETDWSHYGHENNPRCSNCMVHSGFEASALSAMRQSPANLWKTIRQIHV